MIELVELAKSYRKPNLPPVVAIDRVSLTIERGEMVAILGPSGSGKSTLMNVLGLLDRPDSGEYLLDGFAVQKLPDDELFAVVKRCEGDTATQMKWLRTRMKQAAPQALVVAP